ncbi:SRPBCC domain-containing protein [Amycolatopsis sp. FDAARGOS 1241]|uniref:SRPBCC family protein n=1 Tax=Amycolatopsis sp. FDAARGOS 1241 TaxID=2778070 RepID=UPI00195287D6|nr:SRPBCC domain-containing protein [Amycolatopsis sp. FDAARGOS 1241]QRP49233.1 SRPBCC domain-containing protein [Amycolatopsis sp. FDAARGOS 1241]
MTHEFEVAKQVRLPADPEAVWDAVATGPGIDSWFMGKHEVDAGARRVRFRMGEFTSEAEITTWEPPHRFAYRATPAPDGSFDAFEFLVEATGGGTSVLRFIHHGFTAEDWGEEYHEGFSRGWDMYLHTLGQLLRYFPGRRAQFVLASGPESSAAPEAWRKLVAALGLPATPEAGQPVHFEVDGLPAIDGVLDYPNAHYAGIRTAGALYRFHERSALGMPIAVGHHLFFEADPEEQSKVWQAWLERVLG